MARIRTDAAEACRRRDAEAADIARNCAKSFGAARACEVRSKCMVSYFSNFPEGAERGELERVASEADSTCNLVEQERQKAATARACIESRMTSRDPCAIEAQCIAPYLAAFPEGASNLELKGAAQRAREACALRASEAEARRREEESARQREEERQAAEEAERRREEERRAVEEAERRRVEEARVRREADLLAEARRCAASAEACVVEACYRQYLNEHGASTQASVARAAVEAARQLCQQRSGPTFVEGTYSGMVTAGCNAQQQRVHVTLRGGRISWRHEVQVPPSTAAVPFQWDGTIGSDGRIEAKVGNSTDYEAKGSYRDGYGDVRMYYRGCTTGPLSLRFSGSPLPAR